MMLFSNLIKENQKIWDAYLHHDFVKKLEDKSLKQENFLFYLKQDYIYLLNYAKCYARLALNSNTAKELRFAMKFQNYIVEGEMELHRAILSLGINADELDIKDESLVNIAYSRYMLSVGENGDFLDMLVALSACATIGYAKIGAEIINRLKNENLKDHPYKEWILTYGSENFQNKAKEFEDFVNSYTSSVSAQKFQKLSEIFHTVTRLEVAFWEHSLRMELNL
ncbi:TPA: thiaminase II [Campylobacter jejuni]|uniref:thiaminase II n=1 Tax=Campylobacter jejuni TaxID=197 RepID=UPI0011A27938|nr:thiaminase II [Campylobacter jejuni]HAN0733634.1 thiaminase II [Campylobacter jejuni]HEA8077672.1 thiaminase II [Campylobacter jejuni]HEH4632778.1 thiaminase II [Campylobacter jejuni]HEH5025387.1 thiaminase II [Campylobacter jejuni]